MAEMLTRYSKTRADIADHTERMNSENTALLTRQRTLSQALSRGAIRERCSVCEAELAGAERFIHRHVPYSSCGVCGHVQTSALPPASCLSDEQGFHTVYSTLSPGDYARRTALVHGPKLDWLLEAGEQLGIRRDAMLARSWVELGSGSGNFIDALRRAGARQVTGFEADPILVARAQAALAADVVRPFRGSLADAIRQYPADCYAAWFVLEHCLEIPELLRALRDLRAGTLFAFSVPVMGLATLLEAAVDGYFARNLDSVLHLQLFTDRSIRHALNLAGFEPCAEWIFGQDADDLLRMLVAGLTDKYPPALLASETKRLAAASDDLQHALDRHRLADARHVLAIKV
jgi:SAM-dependent methyltransferase